MSFDRHERVRSLVTQLIASFIQEEANPSPLITVTNVVISPDYKEATVLITTIPDSGEDDALIFLGRKAGDLRRFLKKKSSFKIIPHLRFDIDHGERHRQHIDEIARDIENGDTKQ